MGAVSHKRALPTRTRAYASTNLGMAVEVVEDLVCACVEVVLLGMGRAGDGLHAVGLQMTIHLVNAKLFGAPAARQHDRGIAVLHDRSENVHARLAAGPLLLVGRVKDSIDIQEDDLERQAVTIEVHLGR